MPVVKEIDGIEYRCKEIHTYRLTDNNGKVQFNNQQ